MNVKRKILPFFASEEIPTVNTIKAHSSILAFAVGNIIKQDGLIELLRTKLSYFLLNVKKKSFHVFY